MAPLVQRRGLPLVERPAYKGILLKDTYWRWPEHDLAAAILIMALSPPAG